MSYERISSPVTRQWIGALSEERIGQIWRRSDHEELLRNLRLADELAVALLQLAQCTTATEQADRSAPERVSLEGGTA